MPKLLENMHICCTKIGPWKKQFHGRFSLYFVRLHTNLYCKCSKMPTIHWQSPI